MLCTQFGVVVGGEVCRPLVTSLPSPHGGPGPGADKGRQDCHSPHPPAVPGQLLRVEGGAEEVGHAPGKAVPREP